jgi:intracellular sulfur oxidation DsrE/DsrF family protein
MDARVIFHVDEMGKWNLLLHNVANLLVSYEDTHTAVKTIEVLANSEAVKAYAGDGDAFAAMDGLSKKGVRFAACSNALRGFNIAKEQLYPFVDIVPAGVRELADRQHEGYAYIKP